MKVLAAAGYLILFWDFQLAHMIKTYRSASCHQVLKIRERYICYIAKMSEQEYCLNLKDSVPEKMNLFYMFPYKSIFIGA